MVRRLSSLLRRIAGRVKKYMSALFLSLGVMFVPLGFYILVEGSIGDWYGRIAVIVGIMCQIIAYALVREEQRQADLRFILQFHTSKDSFENLLEEIKGLRQDLKGRIGGQNGSDKGE